MMTRTEAIRRLRAGLVMLLGIAAAGCAGPGVLRGSENTATPFRDPAMSMQNASRAVVVGQSTRDGVADVLGPATVVKFESGFEVWVYRENRSAEASAKAEFVILFARSGVVKKTRLRPAI